MTRMLPASRLKCLLLSHAAASSDILAGGVGVGGLLVANNGAIPAGGGGGNNTNSSVGWGTIGYSIHVGDCNEQHNEPSLPSPSFARQSLPSVSTPYGNLCCSVMYDATLNPNHMMNDLMERRSEWIQRQCYWSSTDAGAGGGMQQFQGQLYQHQGQLYPQQFQQNQLMHHVEQQQYIQQGSVTQHTSSTRPIPIHARQQNMVHQQQQAINARGTPTIHSLPQQVVTIGSREYRSCPTTALIGGPASLGAPTTTMAGGRSRAVSDFIISDYHNSPRLKPLSADANNATPAQLSLASPPAEVLPMMVERSSNIACLVDCHWP